MQLLFFLDEKMGENPIYLLTRRNMSHIESRIYSIGRWTLLNLTINLPPTTT